MTQTLPEPFETDKFVGLAAQVGGGPTEMGFEVRIHSRPVNIHVELDLDYGPEFFRALVEQLPQIVKTMLYQCSDDDDDDDDESPDDPDSA